MVGGLGKMVNGSGRQVRHELENVQTWMDSEEQGSKHCR